VKGNTVTKILSVLVVLFVVACGAAPASTPTPVKETQAQKAAAAANALSFTENAEIDNIKRRLELTSQPGLLGFIVLLNETGQPVMYTTVKGKLTSRSKRLTKPYDVKEGWDCGEAWCDKELPAASDEGTFGSSGEYVFFWTTSGQYIQWNGKYLYSDKPFRLSVQPIVIATQDAPSR
jgi:hypothetical protein